MSWLEKKFLWEESANKLRAYNLLKRMLIRLPFLQHNNYTFFVILSYPRSGTTWLHTNLNSHPRILSVGEEYRPFFTQPNGEKKLQEVSKRPLPRLLKAMGMKLFYEEAQSKPGVRLMASCLQEKHRIIHLRRRNLLRVVLSEKIAEQTAEWSSGTPLKALQEKRISLDPIALVDKILGMQAQERYFESLLQGYPHVFPIWYEDLMADTTTHLFQLQQFLGVVPQSLYSLLQKQNPEPLHLLIANYDTIKAVMLEQGWEDFLTD